MGFDIMYFLIAGVIYNAIFLICASIAQYKASQGKSYAGLLITGSIFTFIPIIGNIMGYRRNPSAFTLDGLASPIVFYVIVLIIFIVSCSKAHARALEEKDTITEADATISQKEEDTNSQSDNQ